MATTKRIIATPLAAKKSSAVVVKKRLLKKVIGYTPRIRSRHPSHNVLRGILPRMTFTSVIRFGSETESDARVELNSIESIRNSSSKLRMKICFMDGDVKTADWCSGENATIEGVLHFSQDAYPIVAKTIYGSRGQGNTLLRTRGELETFLQGKDLSHYIFEKFYNYVREYRLHVTADGCFYTCRKMLKSDTPDDSKWFRNDSNCIWAVETNPDFDRPVNWPVIERECVKALISCGLDFGACDLRVQSAKDGKGRTRENPDFIVVEINSAPSFGDLTAERYAEILPVLLIKKSKV